MDSSTTDQCGTISKTNPTRISLEIEASRKQPVQAPRPVLGRFMEICQSAFAYIPPYSTTRKLAFRLRTICNGVAEAGCIEMDVVIPASAPHPRRKQQHASRKAQRGHGDSQVLEHGAVLDKCRQR